MCKVSLTILIYLIWEEKNKRVFDNYCTPVSLIFPRFQILFYMVLHFHESISFRVVVVLFVGAASVLSLLVMAFLGWGCSVG
jgi:hypothetical protein